MRVRGHRGRACDGLWACEGKGSLQSAEESPEYGEQLGPIGLDPGHSHLMKTRHFGRLCVPSQSAGSPWQAFKKTMIGTLLISPEPFFGETLPETGRK